MRKYNDGGSVWQFREDAEMAASHYTGYSVYGVIANWDSDTAETNDMTDIHFGEHSLIISSQLVKL